MTSPVASLAPVVDDFFEAFTARRAARGGVEIQSISVDEAYEVQRQVIARRVARGETVVGFKIGCVSRGVREQFGLNEPVMGRLLTPHVLPGGSTLELNAFVGCAIEPEFVFRIGADVTAAFLARHNVAAAIAAIAPGIEVHNYVFRYGAPTSQELIASNGIHAALVVGEERPFSDRRFDFESEGIDLFVDDVLTENGFGRDIMGSPLRTLEWLADKLLREGDMLREGDLVIPGSPVGLVRIERRCRVETRIAHFGGVTADFRA